MKSSTVPFSGTCGTRTVSGPIQVYYSTGTLLNSVKYCMLSTALACGDYCVSEQHSGAELTYHGDSIIETGQIWLNSTCQPNV